MKGSETLRSFLERNLSYLYQGLADPQKPLERNLFYLYEGPGDLGKPPGQEFVLPI